MPGSDAKADDGSESELDQVDIPVVVEPDTAGDILDDLKENGRVTIEVRTSNAPKVPDQIEWQLENDQPLLEFTEDYDAN